MRQNNAGVRLGLRTLLRYEGVPLPLNSYAQPSAYAPYVGANATEQFGLPFRTIYFS